MKKISLIACAALVAGLLVSCNNATEAGTVDYNSIRKTSNENSYILSGTITEVEEYEDAEFTVTNNKESQSAGTKSKETYVTKFDKASAYVKFDTDSVADTNHQDYAITYDASMGWDSYEDNLEQTWSTDKWVNGTTNSKRDFFNGDANYPIDADQIFLSCIDGVFYLGNMAYPVEVEVDEDAISSGESFTLKATFVASDTSDTTYSYTADNKDVTGRTANSAKTTVTYDLTFTAK